MRILVVEDEVKVAALLKGGLTEHGFAVEVCHDGNTAVERAMKESFDAIILDIMLPGRDGLSVLRKLREACQTVPVILLTARGDVNERVEGLNLGADDYFSQHYRVRIVGVSAVFIAQGPVWRNVCLAVGFHIPDRKSDFLLLLPLSPLKELAGPSAFPSIQQTPSPPNERRRRRHCALKV